MSEEKTSFVKEYLKLVYMYFAGRNDYSSSGWNTQYVDMLMQYLLDEQVPIRGPFSRHEMDKVWVFYEAAHPIIQERLDKVVLPWKLQVYKDPDKENYMSNAV